MTISTMHSVVLELKRRDIPATLEYPGFICVPGRGNSRICFGDANETIQGDVTEETGEIIETIDSTIPANSDDAKRIADHIAGYYVEERQ